MTSFPAGHLFWPPASELSDLSTDLRQAVSAALICPQSAICSTIQRPNGREERGYLILDSRNSTCFLATGSYFRFTSLSVIVREFFLVT